MLLIHGTLFRVGIQVSSVLIVVPYIADQAGSPGLVVALIIPAFTAGTLLGTAMGPKVLRITVSVAALLGGLTAVDAALTALIAVDIAVVPSRLVAYPLLLLCVLIGIVSGSLEVVSPMVLSALLPARQRSNLLLQQSGYAAASVVVITAFFATGFVRGSLSWQNIDLVWMGVVAMLLCAACCFALRTPGVQLAGGGPARMRDAVSAGHSYFRTNPWMQRFLFTELFFVTVTLSPMFYVIYSAELLGAGNGDMDEFLVFIGIGLLCGIVVWRLVRTRWGVRGMYLFSGGISVAAAIIGVVSQHWQLLPRLWTFGPVLLLSALASQAVWPAAYDWLFQHASAEHAAVVVSYTRFVTSLAVVFVGFALAVAAEQAPAVWPLGLLLALTVVACLTVTRIPPTVATLTPVSVAAIGPAVRRPAPRRPWTVLDPQSRRRR